MWQTNRKAAPKSGQNLKVGPWLAAAGYSDLRRRSRKKAASSVSGAAASTAATVYDSYLKDELARQDARQNSFEQRGLAVVTTAGTLVTLLFAVAALSTTTGSAISLGSEEHTWLAIALGLFLLAAASALATNWPLKYRGPETVKILALLTASEEDAPNDATRAVAETRAEILSAAQRKNKIKEHLLFGALALEFAAVSVVAVAIVEVLHPTF
jgi:hypothetical protein